MGSKQVHFDRHIFTPGVEHVLSEDCWCEPTRQYWLPTTEGHMIHVLEHNDDLFGDHVMKSEIKWVKGILSNL